MGPPLKPVPAVDEQLFDGCSTPVDGENEYKLPTLEELGIEMPEESSAVLFPGGETEALRRLDEHMEKKVCILLSEFNLHPCNPNGSLLSEFFQVFLHLSKLVIW